MGRRVDRAQVERWKDTARLVEEMADAVLVVDTRDHQVVLANAAARQMRDGLDPVERRMRCYEFTHGRPRPCRGADGPCPIGRVKRTGRATRVTHRHRGPGGKLRVVDIHASPVSGPETPTDFLLEVCRDVTSDHYQTQEREELILRLEDALARIKTLRGMIPVCGWCRRIRDDEGYWNQLEAFITDQTDASVTHGICPDCAETLGDGDVAPE